MISRFVQPREGQFGENLVEQGKTLVRTDTEYQTAIAVMEKRDVNAVLADTLTEAELLGADAQYALPFRTKTCPTCGHKESNLPLLGTPCSKCKTPMQNIVTGETVKLAHILKNNWGNCVTETKIIGENSQAWTIKAVYIDLEKGVNDSNTATVKKPTGQYVNQRDIEKTLNAAMSRLLRNLILRNMPHWLKTQAVERALNTVVANILKAGTQKSAKKILRGLSAVGVPNKIALGGIGIESIDDLIDDDEDHAELLADLNSKWAAIKNNEEKAETLFPQILEEKQQEAEKPEEKKAADDVLGDEGKKKPDEKEPLRQRYADLIAERGKDVVEAYFKGMFPIPLSKMSIGEMKGALNSAEQHFDGQAEEEAEKPEPTEEEAPKEKEAEISPAERITEMANRFGDRKEITALLTSMFFNFENLSEGGQHGALDIIEKTLAKKHGK